MNIRGTHSSFLQVVWSVVVTFLTGAIKLKVIAVSFVMIFNHRIVSKCFNKYFKQKCPYPDPPGACPLLPPPPLLPPRKQLGITRG